MFLCFQDVPCKKPKVFVNVFQLPALIMNLRGERERRERDRDRDRDTERERGRERERERETEREHTTNNTTLLMIEYKHIYILCDIYATIHRKTPRG